MQSIAMSVYVFLSVCLSARLSQNLHGRELIKFLYCIPHLHFRGNNLGVERLACRAISASAELLVCFSAIFWRRKTAYSGVLVT